MNPFSLTRLGEDDIVTVTPYRDQLGRRMMIYKIGNWRPSKISIDDIFRASLILFEMGALEPQTQVAGGIGIFDLEGLSLNHAWYVTPSVAKKMISLMVVSIPPFTHTQHGTHAAKINNLLLFSLSLSVCFVFVYTCVDMYASSNQCHSRNQQQLGIRYDLPDIQAIHE